MHQRWRICGLIVTIVIILSGCAFRELKKEIEEMESNVGLGGKIISPSPLQGNVFVLLFTDNAGRKEIYNFNILEKEDIAGLGLTTHDIPLRMLMEYLEKETRAHICMLAVQPARVAFGAAMSGHVAKALDELSELIRHIALHRSERCAFHLSEANRRS